jgi:hypothetical protein
MTEHEVFESRLRAALLRHVADGPTEFDALGFARLVAAKEPRRRGLAAALTKRGVAIPRVAWVLLLLAGLLAALVGGMLVVGSQLARRLPAVVPPVGQLFECPPGSTPDTPGPVDQARPRRSPHWPMVFDRHAGRLVALADAGYGLETWTFDVCTNTWTQMHPNREPPRVEVGQLVYDVDSDVAILVASGKVWAYDLQANTWTEQGVVPTGATLCAFDPLSGRVVAAKDAAKDTDPIELWNYDVETDTWTPMRQTNRLGSLGYGAYGYDASADRIIEFARGVGPTDETWLLDIRTGSWSRPGAEAPDLRSGLWTLLPAIVYDEAAERTVFSSDYRLAAYDATADRWEILIETDFPDFLPNLSVYDPVNGRLVGLGSGGTVGQGAVVAFDLETRQWTVLLDWSEEQPAPAGATQRP